MKHRTETYHRHMFTLAELLAAMLLMSIIISVAVAAVQHTSRAGEMTRRAEIAARLGKEKLRELIITGDWQTSDENGDYGEEWPEFSWGLSVQDWGEDEDLPTTMTIVSLETRFPVQGVQESHVLCTLVTTEQ